MIGGPSVGGITSQGKFIWLGGWIYSLIYGILIIGLPLLWELVLLRVNYVISNDVILSIAGAPDDGDIPMRPPPECVTLLVDYSKEGLWLSIHAPVRPLLVAMNIAPSNSNPMPIG